MIREEYLPAAVEIGLICARNLRDVAVVTETGYRSTAFQHTLAYERIRIYLELLLREISSCATGLVKPRDAILSEYTAAAEIRTSDMTGVTISSDITAAEARALSRSTPPVGKLPGVYERTKASAERGYKLASALQDSLSALYDGAACGRILHSLPLSAIEAFARVAEQAKLAFQRLESDKADRLSADTGVVDKLVLSLADGFDPIYEAELKRALYDRTPDCVTSAAAAAVKGAKSVQVPILADLVCRYTSI